jgi:PAS domain S-box-containing protein
MSMTSPLDPASARPRAESYGVAAGCVALAIAARAALTPVLGDHTPFVTVFLAVLAAAEVGGFGAAVATAVAGGLLAWALFVPSREVPPLVAYGFASFGTCLFVRRSEVARAQAAAGAAALRDREDVLRTLADNLPAAVYQAVREPGKPTRFRHMSAGVERLAGVTPAAILADPAALFSLIHPDDLPGVVAAEDEAVRAGTPFDREFRQRTADGRPIWVHARSVPRAMPDGSVVYDGLVTDVTDRKQVEAELARVAAEADRARRLYETCLSNTPDFVYVFSLDHRVVYANDALVRMWGHSPENTIGKTFLEIGYEPWHAEMHAREIDEVRATGRPIRGEVPFTGTLGRRIYDYIFVPVFGADGGVEAVAGTTRDVTDRKAAEDALREEARRKDEFLAMLGHELRNPLAPIRSGLAVLAHPRTDAEAAARVRGMMGRQVEHLVRLVDDLLDIARIMQGKIDLRRDRTDLAGVVARAVETARPGIDGRNHALAVDLPPGPVWVDGDEVRLTQVVANLLNNAAKYTDPGGRVGVALAADGGEAVVRVTDSGVGIPADKIGAVFDLFVQVDKAAARTDGGLGVGLTLVRRLVEMHDGAVSAASGGPGAGSEFTVRLPMRNERPEPKQAGADGSSDAAVRSPQSAMQKRVLVVDDNADAAATLSAVLELHGHQVWTAHDGQAALGLAANGCRPDAVVLDIGLPGMDGYEVARRLRAGPSAGAVLIALTGYGQDDDRRKATAAGFDHHFTKPVDLDQLAKVLTGSAS